MTEGTHRGCPLGMTSAHSRHDCCAQWASRDGRDDSLESPTSEQELEVSGGCLSRPRPRPRPPSTSPQDDDAV